MSEAAKVWEGAAACDERFWIRRRPYGATVRADRLDGLRAERASAGGRPGRVRRCGVRPRRPRSARVGRRGSEAGRVRDRTGQVAVSIEGMVAVRRYRQVDVFTSAGELLGSHPTDHRCRVCHYQCPKVCHFRYPLTYQRQMSELAELVGPARQLLGERNQHDDRAGAVGVKIPRSRDSRAATTNWSRAETASRVASGARPSAASAGTRTAIDKSSRLPRSECSLLRSLRPSPPAAPWRSRAPRAQVEMVHERRVPWTPAARTTTVGTTKIPTTVGDGELEREQDGDHQRRALV